MKNFIQTYFARIKTQNNNQRIIAHVQRLIADNWSTATTKNYSNFTTERNLEKTFSVGTLDFRVFRGFRGDLIEVSLKDEMVVEYVDQSHQYDGLMGLNDIVIHITKEEFENAIQTIIS